jgi:hypothetical protein
VHRIFYGFTVIGICICGHYRVYDGTECTYCLDNEKAIDRMLDLLDLGFDPFLDVTLLKMATIAQIKQWITELKLMVPFWPED